MAVAEHSVAFIVLQGSQSPVVDVLNLDPQPSGFCAPGYVLMLHGCSTLLKGTTVARLGIKPAELAAA